MNALKSFYGAAGLIIVGLLFGLLAVLEVVLSHADTSGDIVEPREEWASALDRVDRAVTQGNVSGALAAWHDVYMAALDTRSWEGLVAAADSYLRIGEVAGSRRTSELKARDLYLHALFRARRQGSLDGALRATEGLTALGEREIAREALCIADGLARGRDAGAQARVQAVSEQLGAQQALAGVLIDRR